MAEIQIKHLAKSFGSYQALHNIELTIAHQEFMVLLSASGCGKTTLLRILAGLETASAGEVFINGRRVDHLPPREQNIAMVFQNYAVFPHLTVFENIAFGLRMAKKPEAEISKRVHKNAELMHIDQLLKRYSGELSGGQRQRVAVARALAMEPDVILMDEPLSNLDALLRLEMRAELKGVLAESKTTAIYVTHDQVEAMSLADRISVMHQGKIVQAASPIEIYRNPANQFVAGFIGNPPMNFIEASRLDAKNFKVAGETFQAPDFSPVDKLVFAIRPEDMRIAETGLQAEIKIVEPLGSHLLASCKLTSAEADAKLFRVVLESDAAIKPGDRVKFAPQPERIRWFDPKTSEALKT